MNYWKQIFKAWFFLSILALICYGISYVIYVLIFKNPSVTIGNFLSFYIAFLAVIYADITFKEDDE